MLTSTVICTPDTNMRSGNAVRCCWLVWLCFSYSISIPVYSIASSCVCLDVVHDTMDNVLTTFFNGQSCFLLFLNFGRRPCHCCAHRFLLWFGRTVTYGSPDLCWRRFWFPLVWYERRWSRHSRFDITLVNEGGVSSNFRRLIVWKK